MLKRYSTPIILLMLAILLISIWKFPTATPVVGILLLLTSLAITISFIFEKHKDLENPRPKIIKDVLVLFPTLLLVIFLAGMAGLFANDHIGQRFGQMPGFVAAIVASLIAGYLVMKGMGKIKDLPVFTNRKN